MLIVASVFAPACHAAENTLTPAVDTSAGGFNLQFSLLLAAPTHAQQATAALCSTIQHGLSATGEAENHDICQQPFSAGILQQAFIRQPASSAATAQSTPVAGGRRPASWPCQVAARRAQRQLLQLLAYRPSPQQELALAARMERWAQRSGAEEMHMDSVRRKRKHKMNKVHASAHVAVGGTSEWRPCAFCCPSRYADVTRHEACCRR